MQESLEVAKSYQESYNQIRSIQLKVTLSNQVYHTILVNFLTYIINQGHINYLL